MLLRVYNLTMNKITISLKIVKHESADKITKI